MATRFLETYEAPHVIVCDFARSDHRDRACIAQLIMRQGFLQMERIETIQPPPEMTVTAGVDYVRECLPPKDEISDEHYYKRTFGLRRRK